MTITLYTFSKRKNSTAVPPEGGGISVDCMLKADSSVLNPVLEFQTIDRPRIYNYAYIPDFSRYYYVSEWSYLNGIWYVSLSVDVLATYRGRILTTTAYVEYSASRQDNTLFDSRLASTCIIGRQNNVYNFKGISMREDVYPKGTFCLTAIARDSNWSTGTATTYFLSYTEMQSLARELINTNVWEEIKLFFDNPMDAIIDCYYLPIDVKQYIEYTNSRQIQIANHTFSTTAYSATTTDLSMKYQRITLEIPWTNPADTFLRQAPYSTVSIFVPFCGQQGLDMAELAGAEHVFFDYGVDVTTGNVQGIVYIKEYILAEFSGTCRVSLPVGQSQSRIESIIGAAGGVVGAAAGLAAGNAAAAAIGALNAAGSFITPQTQKVISGSSGSNLGATIGQDTGRWQKIRVTCETRGYSPTLSALGRAAGRLLRQEVRLSTLTGFTQCVNFSLDAPAYERELIDVNDYMNGGVYIE